MESLCARRGVEGPNLRRREPNCGADLNQPPQALEITSDDVIRTLRAHGKYVSKAEVRARQMMLTMPPHRIQSALLHCSPRPSGLELSFVRMCHGAELLCGPRPNESASKLVQPTSTFDFAWRPLCYGASGRPRR